MIGVPVAQSDGSDQSQAQRNDTENVGPIRGCLFEGAQHLHRRGGAYFRICDHEAIRSWRGLDAHVRRRVRAIAIRQQKRPRFLFRHLVRNGASEGTAAKTAWSSRGVWHKSARFGVHKAYGLAWFIGRLNSLEGQWLKHHRPAASGSQMSFAF